MAAPARAAPPPRRGAGATAAHDPPRSRPTGSPRATPPRALEALLAAIDGRVAVHAYRDAARLGRQALELWPEGERGAERLAVVEQYAGPRRAGRRPRRGGARAARGRRGAPRRRAPGRALADAERRIAGIYALQGDRARALAARRVAAEAYAANGLPGEAAAERLVVAGYLQSAGRHDRGRGDGAPGRRGGDPRRARPTCARGRWACEGVARAKLGAFDEGIATIRAGLSLALEHELTLEAAEVYQRLGTAHEVAGDYAGAREALGTAIGLCELRGSEGLEQTCLSCMAYVLRELGDWDQVEQLCGELDRRRRDAGRRRSSPTGCSARSSPGAVAATRRAGC